MWKRWVLDAPVEKKSMIVDKAKQIFTSGGEWWILLFCRMLLQIAKISIKALKYQGFFIKKSYFFCAWGLVLLR